MFDTILDLELIHKGKVRDIYHIDAGKMLMVATDRLSAFDVVLDQPIVGKGKVLTSIANFWFDKTQFIIPNHLTHEPLSSVLSNAQAALVSGRAIIVKKLTPLPIEAIVRGYLVGSGWQDYQATGALCGITLPADLHLAEKLPEALYTPSTKAEIGAHDANISFAQTEELIGKDLAQQIRTVSLKLYQFAADYALARDIIIADTKFEFGLDENHQLTLMDEVLTPDSSRFWPAKTYQVGVNQPSFDKQIVRDYLASLDWNKSPPAPTLPDEIIQKTSEKYAAIQTLLCK